MPHARFPKGHRHRFLTQELAFGKIGRPRTEAVACAYRCVSRRSATATEHRVPTGQEITVATRSHDRFVAYVVLAAGLLVGVSASGQVQAETGADAGVVALPQGSSNTVNEQAHVPQRAPLPPPEIKADEAGVGALSEFEYRLSLLVLVFGVVALVIEAILLSRGRRTPVSATDASRVIVITVIVTGTLFVVTAGFSAETIAPALGLFGTVAGYLIGSGEKRKSGNTGATDEDDDS